MDDMLTKTRMRTRRWIAVALFGLGALAAVALPQFAELLNLEISPANVRQKSAVSGKGWDIHKHLKWRSTDLGGTAVDCGVASLTQPSAALAECAEVSIATNKPFYLHYDGPNFTFFRSAYGLARDSEGNVYQVEYDSRGLLHLGRAANARVSHDNQVRETMCIKPMRIETTVDGIVGCVVPVNEDESESVARQSAIDTTVCAVLAHPSAFNNKMVRIRGRASGNFEYSQLDADGCDGSLWFAYAGGDGPPGLVATVGGGARAGAIDATGRYIRPVPLHLVQDSNFRKFQRLMDDRVKADNESTKANADTWTFYQVAATFTGRIDAVADDVRLFHLKRADLDRADFLGFGQMGLFDAQFVMQSVEGDAVLEHSPPIKNPLLSRKN